MASSSRALRSRSSRSRNTSRPVPASCPSPSCAGAVSLIARSSVSPSRRPLAGLAWSPSRRRCRRALSRPISIPRNARRLRRSPMPRLRFLRSRRCVAAAVVVASRPSALAAGLEALVAASAGASSAASSAVAARLRAMSPWLPRQPAATRLRRRRPRAAIRRRLRRLRQAGARPRRQPRRQVAAPRARPARVVTSSSTSTIRQARAR